MLKVISSSETLLKLADMNPVYVSQNDIDAKKEVTDKFHIHKHLIV